MTSGPEGSIPFYVGLCLAILSTLMIGSGFIFKKRALLRAATRGVRAGDGGLVYLRDWTWWAGLALFAVGEGANFVAYALAPAVLVTPLGGLSVLVCAVLSYQFLGERLNLAGKLGCLICLLGATLVMLRAPKEQVVDSLSEMQVIFFDRAFVIYGIAVLLMACVLIFFLGPRYGKTVPLIYIWISASLGSLSVMACKGLGIAIKEAILKDFLGTITSWFFWMLIGLLICGISVQLYYLNRALDLFNTGLVTALLYVFFTGFVLIASAILFREWVTLSAIDYVELFLALVLIAIGVFMMTLLKDLDFNWKTLATIQSAANSPGMLRGDDAEANDLDACARRKRSRFKPKQSPSTRKSPDKWHLLSVGDSWSSDSSELDLTPPKDSPYCTSNTVTTDVGGLQSGTVDPVLTFTTTGSTISSSLMDIVGIPSNHYFVPVSPNSKDV